MRGFAIRENILYFSFVKTYMERKKMCQGLQIIAGILFKTGNGFNVKSEA
jgi:hypothetical protein